MALAEQDLFADIGKLVKHYNLFLTDGTNLAADRDEILDEFQDADMDETIEGLAATYLGWEAEYAARRAVLLGFVVLRLQDRISVLDEIKSPSSDIATVLAKLHDQLVINSDTVDRSAVTIGSTTAVGTATGSGKGTILTTKILDGVSSPRSGVDSHFQYKGLDSELAFDNDDMSWECVADSFQNGLTEGHETFAWRGRAPDPAGQHGINGPGSGSIAGVVGIHSSVSTYLRNADFETFTTANTPDDWSLLGTAGTHIFEDNSAGDFYHDTSSVRLLGNGSQAEIALSQEVDNNILVANQAYCFTCRYKASASVSAGAFQIIFSGSGYTAGTTEKISVAAGSLATSWTLASFFVNMPATIPSDFALQIIWSGTPTNTKELWIDDIGFGPVQWGGGIGCVAVRGSSEFQIGDRYTATIANDYAGTFQRFFSEALGHQLASAASGESIADSFAE